MSYPTYNNPYSPYGTNNNLLDEQRRRMEEERRRAEEFERYHRVRDGHRPHLG